MERMGTLDLIKMRISCSSRDTTEEVAQYLYPEEDLCPGWTKNS